MEQWKQVEYAPSYEVSSYGNIRNNKRDGKLLRINYERLKKNNTRVRPYLSVNGKSKGYYLHRIVAEHFIPNPENLPEVNHKDGDFYNNCADNLEWISKKDNMKHANENNLITRKKRKIIVKNKKTHEESVYSSMTECAASLGYSNSTVYNTCSGKRKDILYDISYCDETTSIEVSSESKWKEYPGCPKYMVSECGQVKNKKTGRIMMGSKVNGYRFLTLCVGSGKPKLNRLIHRIVAETFLPNPENKPQVNHKDSDILNNHIDNLEWVTARENMNSEETLKNLRAGKKNHMLLVGKPILQIDIETGKIIRRLASAMEGAKYNLPQGSVVSIANYYKKNNKKYSNKTYKQKYIFIYEKDKIHIEKFLELARMNNKPAKKKIIQWDREKTTQIKVYSSIYEASKELDIKHSGISQCCNYYSYNDETRPKCYKLKSYKGYVFTFC